MVFDTRLQAGADVAACNADGTSPLLVASAGGHADCVRLLLKLSDGSATRVGQLFHWTAPLCCGTGRGQGSDVGRCSCTKPCSEAHLLQCSMVIAMSQQVLAADRHGHTPLHAAVEARSDACARMLLEASA